MIAVGYWVKMPKNKLQNRQIFRHSATYSERNFGQCHSGYISVRNLLQMCSHYWKHLLVCSVAEFTQ